MQQIRPGMPVLFSGYPLSLDALTTHQGILSAITTDAVGVTTYLIDGTVNAGNSGCPLMNAQGEILGVVNAKRRERSDLLNKVEAMSLGAISLHGIDLVEIYQALISNVQLGIGYAIPASYIPQHSEMPKPAVKEPGPPPRKRAREKAETKETMTHKFVFKSTGVYVGFIVNGSLYSRDGEYLGWIEGKHVWDAAGRYRGQLWHDDRYIIFNRFGVTPVPRAPKPSPAPQALPNPPANIPAIALPTGWQDSF